MCPGSSPSSLPPAAFPISHWNLPPPKKSLFPNNASVSWIFGYAVGFTARARAGTHTYQRARTCTHIQRHEGSAGGGVERGVRGEERRWRVCAYGWGRRQSGQHIHTHAFLAEFLFRGYRQDKGMELECTRMCA